MSDQKLPKDELTGERNLVGKYRVSFLVDLTENDSVSISDINQSLAEGFESESVLQKIAKVDIEKLDHEGKPFFKKAHEIKAGDKVRLTSDVTVTAYVNYDEPYYVFGQKQASLECIGESTATLPAGTVAVVNNVANNKVELIDFADVIDVPMYDQEIYTEVPTSMDVELVTIDKTYLERVD